MVEALAKSVVGNKQTYKVTATVELDLKDLKTTGMVEARVHIDGGEHGHDRPMLFKVREGYIVGNVGISTEAVSLTHAIVTDALKQGDLEYWYDKDEPYQRDI